MIKKEKKIEKVIFIFITIIIYLFIITIVT